MDCARARRRRHSVVAIHVLPRLTTDTSGANQFGEADTAVWITEFPVVSPTPVEYLIGIYFVIACDLGYRTGTG
jgi:hypothetical protein